MEVLGEGQRRKRIAAMALVGEERGAVDVQQTGEVLGVRHTRALELDQVRLEPVDRGAELSLLELAAGHSNDRTGERLGVAGMDLVLAGMALGAAPAAADNPCIRDIWCF